MIQTPEKKATRNLTLHTWTLSSRQYCDLECLLNGAFSPLAGFLNQNDYDSVCETMRLKNGALWPMPITLDVSESFAHTLKLGESILLINTENTPLASLTIESIWRPDKNNEATCLFQTNDPTHPGVRFLNESTHPYYIGGTLSCLTPLIHYDFINYRHTPAQLKQLFQVYGWSRIVAFQTRNPIHRAHFELTLRAAKKEKAALLLHPVVGMTKPGDIDSVTRMHCYQAIIKHYPSTQPVMLSVLPISMRMAGPREALWHALIRKNYGATHFIIGRDHAGPGLNRNGVPFYSPFAAQTLVLEHRDELGINILAFPELVYVKEKQAYLTTDELQPTDTIETISGTDLRHRLEQRLDIPDWFSFPDVIKRLQAAYPPMHQQGFTLFFTGLSGAGKSTLAKAVKAAIEEAAQRVVTLLDGDEVRKHLSQGLGFSKADRDINIQRLSYVASEITKHHGIAIIAAIAPYAKARDEARTQIESYGGFIEIHVATPLSVCKARDIKGLYLKAEQGLIQGFTGVNDPYETPEHADLCIDTSHVDLQEATRMILSTIQKRGFSWEH